MAGESFTLQGGGRHGMATLSHAEFQAAQHALSRISTTSGTVGHNLGSLSQSAALIGGSVRADALHAPSLLPGLGSDTFLGGARSPLLAGLGRDTVLSGSTKPVEGSLGLFGSHNVSSFALSADTISPAGATALTVKALDPEASSKAHTVTVGDKTTITINGLSAHDISKLSH